MSISISANKPRLSYATAHGYKNKVSTSKMTNNKAKYNNEHETEYSHHEKAQSALIRRRFRCTWFIWAQHPS